jgi:alpha-galactosidase/6-phospho-beta-glucosidase family protein
VARIAFIGAGSVVFTRNLLVDILSFSELSDFEIALHDIDEGRLETAAAMARYVADERGAAPTITSHADRRAALEGADYVLNMVQVGGHAATLVDFEIPARFGVRQTIADTLGIGGIFRALRTADHMLALGREMAELCPSAWLLNYTNPMAMLCWLVYGGTKTKNVVGLCHSVQYTTRRSSFASSAQVKIYTQGSMLESSPIPSFSDESAFSCIAAFDTSPPSRASTLRSTSRGSCGTIASSSGFGSRSTSTSAEVRRTFASTST